MADPYANKAMGFYQLLHEMGVFTPDAPSTFRAFGTRGQLSPAQLIDRYGITCRPVREVQERRACGLDLAAIGAFYLDIAQWAMEDPPRWAPWAAPCPIRAQDLARRKEIRARKSRMDQRTRERLPVLPMLVARVNDMRTMTAARLTTANATAAAASARIWVVDPSTRKRRDLTGEADRAFWTWAAVETLRHSVERTARACSPARLDTLFTTGDAFAELWRIDGEALTETRNGVSEYVNKVHFACIDGISQPTIIGGPETPAGDHQQPCEPWLFVAPGRGAELLGPWSLGV